MASQRAARTRYRLRRRVSALAQALAEVVEVDREPHSPAVVVSSPGSIAVSPVAVGEIGRSDVLIRTHFSGVSTGTDKWVMQGRFTWLGLEFPLVPGYQRFGTVEAVGDDVLGFQVGQEVVATESRAFVDAFPAWGGHASLAASPADEVYDATGIVPERACLFISGQVGFNAASRIPDDRGRRVVVYGDGIIGASGALAAKARGFDVLLVGRHEERLSPMSEFSIATARSGSGSKDAVRDWAPIAVIDTVQSDSAFDDYVDALPTRTGQIVFGGHSPDGTKAWADMERMQQRELTASFVSGWAPDRIGSTLELMRDGSMPLERLADPPDSSARGITDTMTAVAAGTLGPVAAVLDWRRLG
jgi:2-desacetyl-2-hydroxyethyl bacteriochlorophyllide A dehydrogenase